MKQNRLLVVTEYFWPDQASTGRLLGELVQEMEQQEPELLTTVITSQRLYRGPLGYDLPRDEQRGNQRITRLKSHRSGKDRFLRRMWSDIIFSFQAAGQMLRQDYDCVMVVTNPPLLPFILAFVNRFRRKPFVYLIHDLYPDVPVALGQWRKASLFSRVLSLWQRVTLRTSDKVIVLGRCMKDYLVDNYEVRREAVEAIHNWFTVPALSTQLHSNRSFNLFNVVYSGNLGQFQDFETILGAAELLRDVGEIRFHIVGDGARKEYLVEQVRTRGLTNVRLQPFLPDDEFKALLEQTQLGLVTLEPQLEGLGVPSKTYNLLAMGIPLLAVLGTRSEVSRIVTERGCGFQANPGDSQRVAACILETWRNPQVQADMASRARTYAQTHASLQAAAQRYLTVFRQVMQ